MFSVAHLLLDSYVVLTSWWLAS